MEQKSYFNYDSVICNVFEILNYNGNSRRYCWLTNKGGLQWGGEPKPKGQTKDFSVDMKDSSI